MLTENEIKVLNVILPYRIDSPIKFDEVRHKTGLEHRALQKTVKNLRYKGHPIGSLKRENWKGLFMATNGAEMEIGISANVKQANTTLEIAGILRGIDFQKYWSQEGVNHARNN